MNGPPSLASLLESFFRHRLTRQRNASRSTIASYRDALRLLVLFAAERTGRKPCSLTLEDLDRNMILAFLDELEQKRKNTIQTRNARLGAIRSVSVCRRQALICWVPRRTRRRDRMEMKAISMKATR
jgi:integrase/recombinase XerD